MSRYAFESYICPVRTSYRNSAERAAGFEVLAELHVHSGDDRHMELIPAGDALKSKLRMDGSQIETSMATRYGNQGFQLQLLRGSIA